MITATAWVDDHFIAGDVALDLANTVYRRRPELGADLLNNVEALRTWLTRTQLVPADGPAGDVTEATLAAARALRALLWTIFDAQQDGRMISTDAVTGLLDAAGQGLADLSLAADGSMITRTADGAVAILALRAVALVLDPPPKGVRACDRCGWFFIDSSRGRRRRWCSMKTCGNQSKADRYRSSHP